MNEPLILELDGAVARLRFNRPGVLNALDESMARAVLESCQVIQADPAVRVVVLSGEGRSFMAGGDLARFYSDLDNAGETANALIEPIHQAALLLTNLPQPVLASLHGPVAGAGVSLALACDLAIAADDARFNLAYAKVGASPDVAATWNLPRLVGLRKALELALLADDVDASEALRLGLVNRVVARANLAEATEELVQRLANGPTQAYGRIKQLLRASSGRSLEQQLDAEREAFCAGTQSNDFREGLAAFFERRASCFTGS